MTSSHVYWHVVANNGNFILLLTSSGPDWQFHISTDIWWSRMAISHLYWHLVVQKGNFKFLQTSSGQEWQLSLQLTSRGQGWQFHIYTCIYWSRMAISHLYWHLVVRNGNFTFILAFTGPEWQFHIYTDI